MRRDGRQVDEIRSCSFERDYTEMALGSVLVSMGKTRVLCTVSLDEKVPPWLRGTGKGWITAEYSLLPGSSPERVSREAVKGRQSGRTQEIQRLIGRSIRAVVDLNALGEKQLIIDCDVLQADGGTRTASICGAYVALADAVSRMEQAYRVGPNVLLASCAAISVGIVEGGALLDLDYSEDVRAEVDMNVVMTSDGYYVEVQGTAENSPYTKAQLDDMLSLAEHGIAEILEIQSKTLSTLPSVKPELFRN
ncbi:MAG: ribonuclease PH [Actinomycetota bacterium]|jgi:ribonuclease PH|nr:ribonuclease PH [Actinomycetota bacterium]